MFFNRPMFSCQCLRYYSHVLIGLYKFNRNSMDCIVKLKEAMDDVVGKLLEEEESDAELETRKSCDVQIN